jgi:diguanylate cyclase (GGDEF)-like protein/PAS domain S-box-containing protein
MASGLSYESILNSLDQNIFIKDLSFKYIYANKNFLKMVDKDVDSLVGGDDYDYFPKDIADEYRKHDYFVIKNNETIDFKDKMKIDGKYKTIRKVKKPLYNNGDIVGVIGVFWDISENEDEKNRLEKLQKGLWHAENDLLLASNVFTKMHDGVMITDANQKILSVNEAFTKVTGYSKSEILGKKPNILNSGWHDDKFYQELWEDISKNGQFEGEIVDRKKDGTTYTAEVRISEVHNDDGLLTNYIAISNDITNKKEQEKLIHNLAYFDSLTDLPNRILFEERVTNRILAHKRANQKMAVMFIDMDNFKNINDRLGHSFGDLFLIETSKKIKNILREQDTLARLGGDEFTVMIENFESLESVAHIAKRIIELFERPIYLDDYKVFSGVSLGISIYPDDGTTYEDLVKAADTAMYQVKDSGKRDYKFYTPIMNEEVTKRIGIEHNLHNAIKNEEFFLEYQPKVDLLSNKVYGMEALVRWNQPEHGLVRPDHFIGIAEDTGMIYDIGLWVMEQAIHDLKLLHDLDNTLTVSINVSSKQLEKESFINDLYKIVDKYGVNSNFIELEITESHIMNNIDETLNVLNKLNYKGFKLSIDDFGTGYSSLSYLKKLPVQTIKIDKSFVLDIDKDEEDRSIVSTIIAMSHALGKDVIAEGSETQGPIDALKFMHCRNVQGYFFSKPLAFESFKKYLETF